MTPAPPFPPRTKTNHYFSRETAPLSPADLEKEQLLALEFAGQGLQFLTGAGLFSRAELDEGSRLLLETLHLHGDFPPAARVCDLGCGWGAVGALWAKTHPDHFVFALDVNPRAVQVAALNFARNQISNASLWCADGLSACRSEVFDVVACNPPIRAGNAVIASLFEGAHRCLKRNGQLWAVIRTAQGAKSWAKRLEAQFGACETVEMRAGFRILKAVKA